MALQWRGNLIAERCPVSPLILLATIEVGNKDRASGSAAKPREYWFRRFLQCEQRGTGSD